VREGPEPHRSKVLVRVGGRLSGMSTAKSSLWRNSGGVLAVLLLLLVLLSFCCDSAASASASRSERESAAVAKKKAAAEKRKPQRKASAQEDLQAAILAVQSSKGGSRKIAEAKLRRALEVAKTADGERLSAQLLQDAEDALQGSKAAEGRQQAAKDRLAQAAASAASAASAGPGGAASEAEAAAEAAASELRAALAAAREEGLGKSSEVAAAEKALADLEWQRKEAKKVAVKRGKLRKEVESLTAMKDDTVNATLLKAALLKAQAVLGTSQEDAALLTAAQIKLEAAAWFALPLADRLEKASLAFGREACSPPADRGKWACQKISDKEMLKRSRAIGEASCNHPTLRDGDQAEKPPLQNALRSETAKNFCRYPPPFDLRESEDGRGFRSAQFEFPEKLFNLTAIQEENFGELAVVNLDMNLFRSNIATCGEFWLIEFYVHWCPHCMSVMPKFYKLAVALRSMGAKLRIGAVNCATQKELCGAFRVIGHPLAAFFYPAGGNPSGQVQLFEYAGKDVRVNTALNYLKAHRNPAWDAGLPEGMEPQRHLFSAEATNDLIRLLPEEYRPTDAVMRWLGNASSAGAGVVCPEKRPWYDAAKKRPQSAAEGPGSEQNGSETEEQEEGEEDEEEEKKDQEEEPPTDFPGSGWPGFEHRATAAHRIQDAAQAVVYTLEEWVVPSIAGPSPHGFAYKELLELQGWVSLLAASLPSASEGGPPELGAALGALRRELAKRLRNIEAADGRGALCLGEWRGLVAPVRGALEAAVGRAALPSLCRTETCRIWTLLHLLSIAPLARLGRAEEAGGEEVGGNSDAGNGAAFDAMIAFLRRYFTCNSCRKHFLQQVDAGMYNLAGARVGGPRELALWWWRLHTAVSASVAKEGKCKADRRWPAADVCTFCWGSRVGPGGKVAHEHDEAAIASELVRQYWPRKPEGDKEIEAKEL